MIIAIDGHSSCGKSTLARDLAKELAYTYIDSGAMYRAVTLFFLRDEVDYSQISKVENALENIDISWAENHILLNGEDVESLIRKPEVAEHVSPVAAISKVRSKLVDLQRSYGLHSNVVMDGRDIGTVVFPDADFKFFVTASIEERTKRRYLELKQKGMELSFSEVRTNLSERDRIDSTREDSPLRQADDAIVLDTTHLTRQEQMMKTLEIIQA